MPKDEPISDSFIAQRFLNYCRVTGKRRFTIEDLDRYLAAMEWSYGSMDALLGFLGIGDQVVMARPDQANPSLYDVVAVEMSSVPSAPVPGAVEEEHPVTLLRNDMEAVSIAYKEGEMVSTEVNAVRKSRKGKTAKNSVKKDGQRKRPAHRAGKSRDHNEAADGASEKYIRLAAHILEILPRDIFLGRSNILAEAEKNGIDTGNWLTLVKYLQRGTPVLAVKDNGQNGNRKKYMVSGPASVDSTGSRLLLDSEQDSTALQESVTAIRLEAGDKPIVITIRIDIGPNN